MYKDNVVLCVVPARSGSKGLPGKNIKKLLGKPMITYSIEQALKSKYIDRVIVSTNDVDIANVGLESGAEVPFMRPDELAGDNTCTIDVLLHAIDWMEHNECYDFDILVLLHVTSPLRNVDDVDNCIKILVEKNGDNIFSVTNAYRNPYFNMVEIKENGVATLVKEGNFVTRQSAPMVFDMNASIYVWWKDVLKEKKGIFLGKTYTYEMPKERSVDIDDYMDFKVAEVFLKHSISDFKES